MPEPYLDPPEDPYWEKFVEDVEWHAREGDYGEEMLNAIKAKGEEGFDDFLNSTWRIFEAIGISPLPAISEILYRTPLGKEVIDRLLQSGEYDWEYINSSTDYWDPLFFTIDKAGKMREMIEQFDEALYEWLKERYDKDEARRLSAEILMSTPEGKHVVDDIIEEGPEDTFHDEHAYEDRYWY